MERAGEGVDALVLVGEVAAAGGARPQAVDEDVPETCVVAAHEHGHQPRRRDRPQLALLDGGDGGAAARGEVAERVATAGPRELRRVGVRGAAAGGPVLVPRAVAGDVGVAERGVGEAGRLRRPGGHGAGEEEQRQRDRREPGCRPSHAPPSSVPDPSRVGG